MKIYQDNFLVSYFKVNKKEKLIRQKYYWLTIQVIIEAYIQIYEIFIDLEAMKNNLYKDFPKKSTQ